MRFPRALALALALTPALLLASPSGASATVLCAVNMNPCPAEQAYAVPSKFEAGLAPSVVAEFANGTFSVKCKGSILQMKTTEDRGPGEALIGEETGLSFESCGGSCTNAATEGLPYKKLSFEYELLGVGTMIIAGENKKVAVKFTGCPAGATCAYDTTAIEFEFLGGETAEMPSWTGTPAFAKTAGPGACPANLSFKARYQMAVMGMWAKRE